jgi:transcription antitermination protein NusB
MKPSDRRNAREYALQAMYQWHISDTPLHELELQFLTHEIRKKTDVEYFKELMHAIPKQCDELDQAMKPFLSRPIKEIDPVELAILRVATYELEKRPDIPYRVVINEALELTKRFGSIEGFKFVNGVLDQVARLSRQVEVTQDKKK